MSTKKELANDMKTAAIAALTLGATSFGAPEASAAVSDAEMEAKTEFVTDVTTSNIADDAIAFEQSEHPSYYPTADAYARANGLVRDSRLSRGLTPPNREWSGYAGAYINYNVPPDSYDRVVFLPNDMQSDYNRIRSCRVVDANVWKNEHREAYFVPQNAYHHGNGHYGNGYHGHGHYGPGSGSEAGRVIREVGEGLHHVGHAVEHFSNLLRGRDGR